jgi:hypothetical protein
LLLWRTITLIAFSLYFSQHPQLGQLLTTHVQLNNIMPKEKVTRGKGKATKDGGKKKKGKSLTCRSKAHPF